MAGWARADAVIGRVKRRVAGALYRALAPIAPARPSDGRGRPSVVGFFGAPSGIGESARLARAGLDRAGLGPTGGLDVAARFGQAIPELPPPAVLDDGAGPLIVHANPPELPAVLTAIGRRRLARRWRVGYWVWELPRAPTEWSRTRGLVHEIWTPSEFSATALRATLPGVEVRVVPHPMAPTHGKSTRARFGLPADAFVALTLADPRSSLARKNPEGAIAAFARAFGADTGARLVVKLGPSDTDRRSVDRLRAGAAANVVFLDAPLDASGVADLVASCDVLLSLHRAEGFGLTLAEAMFAGKPTIATGWSGNMDFMPADAAVLLPYRSVPVVDPSGLYVGGNWAEPDVEAATAALRGLRADPARRAAIGARARAHCRSFFDPARWRARLSADFIARCAQGGA